MAGIGESEKSLSAAKTLLAEMETTVSRVAKRTAALNAIKFSEQIAEGNISLKETEEIYHRLGDDVDAIAEELIEIAGKTEKVKNLTIDWADQVGNVSKNLLGISMPALTINGLLKAAVGTTIDWYNHTFEINRQMYDINASLGAAGTKGLEFEGIISDTALAFHAQFDEVRNVADGLADIGMNGDDIKDTLDDVFAITRNWSDITPEKQMSLMSAYMKEFGMNGKDAFSVMNSLYQTSQDLRKDLPNLDIQKFVDQTQSVALSMRSYGIEAQDAIALTSTLARLGVEQARIPEIAERIGGIGLQGAAETGYMAQQFLMPQERTRRTELIRGLEEEVKVSGMEIPEDDKKRLDTIIERGWLKAGDKELLDQLANDGILKKESVAEIGEVVRRLNIARGGVIGAIGVMATAEGPERTKAQMSMFESMLGKVGVSLSDPIEKIVGGLTAVDLPGIGKMNIAQAEAFAEAVKEMQKKFPEMKLEEVVKNELKKTSTATEDAKKKAEEQRSEQIASAKEVSAATINAADQLSVISENVGNIVRLMGGETAMTIEEQRLFEDVKEQGYVGEFDAERVKGFQKGTERKAKAREAFLSQAKSPEEILQYDIAAKRKELGEFYQATKGEEAKQAAYEEFELGGLGVATSEVAVTGDIEVKVSMDDVGNLIPTIVQDIKMTARKQGSTSKLK